MIVLQLLDAAQNHPLQSWSFPTAEPITIGRSDENTVVLADPFVSRVHARVECVDGNWRVISLSEQQLALNGQKFRELPLEEGAVFQLGLRGCSLRFSNAREVNRNLSTMVLDPAATPIFQLNTQELERQVAEISAGDYFGHLQQAAQRLRKNRTKETS